MARCEGTVFERRPVYVKANMAASFNILFEGVEARLASM